MEDYASLEIGLSRYDAESYSVELRYMDPDFDDRSYNARARFDFPELRRLSADAGAYGQKLSQSLFLDPNVREMFTTSCALDNPGDKLRVRLFIDRSAPELHSLRWETLTDPRPDLVGSRLLDDERILFSRYLRSIDRRRAGIGPKAALRALIVVADPKPDPQKPKVPKVMVSEELSRARASLTQVAAQDLASDPNDPGRVSLNNVIEKLREGFDILYLVCHGALLRDPNDNLAPYIWLEDEDGTPATVAGIDLVDRLRKLSTQPRMIVLASCESAGLGDTAERPDENEALAALGPRLVEGGIPAVLAMQGKVEMETVARFMPVFFTQLSEHGQIELAMSIARGAVRDRQDWWMPVLFSRLRRGQFWYQPGFRSAEGRPEFDWKTFLRRLHDRRCTPILGYGLFESVLGSTREIAKSWSDTYKFPMERHNEEDLPQVAQYLKAEKDSIFPYEELGEYLLQRLHERYGDIYPVDPQLPAADRLDQILKHVIADRAQQNPAEPHHVLARLPFEVYITTNADNVLATSLENAGKKPTVFLCPWNKYVEQMRQTYDDIPTVKAPLVFHLFGQLREPRSLVLTEDDYFDYLIGVTNNRDLIPDAVLGKQSNSQLLFLGFQTEAWNLRVLLRSIQRQRQMDNDDWSYKHIAVQIDPDEDPLVNPGRAREYLEKYFGAPANKIGIYWGNAEDFIKELRDRWNETYPAEALQ
jgi:hypothetical protein